MRKIETQPEPISIFDQPQIDLDRLDRDRAKFLTPYEEKFLEEDGEFYLECMHGKKLSTVKDRVEVRDALILFWHVYLECKNPSKSDEENASDLAKKRAFKNLKELKSYPGTMSHEGYYLPSINEQYKIDQETRNSKED